MIGIRFLNEDNEKKEIPLSDFEYDIRSLVMAYYPNEKIDFSSDNSSYLEICVSSNKIKASFYQENNCLISKHSIAFYENKGEYKNILKRIIYDTLGEYTKKKLVWGTLTGIRPVKIPMYMLEEEKSVNHIRDYMKEQYYISDEKLDLSIEIAQKELNILKNIDYKKGYSIYIGIPFCPSRCLYCSFTSYSIEKYNNLVEPYLDALFKEIEFAKTALKDKVLHTIYVGGGTPTTLTAIQLDKLLKKINETLDLSNLKEFTVEAGRPDSISYDKLKVLKQNNITRISINPQTMNQATLDLIGRRHTVKQIEDVYYNAREIGHNNINMDIILGLNNETYIDVENTLSKILKMSPDNITVHTLAIKRAARLNIYKDKYILDTQTDVKRMLDISEKLIRNSDYFPYYLYRQKNMSDNLENTGYAKVNKEGIYNILIMEEKQTILALGAGAMSKYVFHEKGNIERTENVKDVIQYIKRINEMIYRKKKFIDDNM